MPLSCISEVKETSNVNEVNFLLKEGWRLLMVGASCGKFHYVLGQNKK